EELYIAKRTTQERALHRQREESSTSPRGGSTTSPRAAKVPEERALTSSRVPEESTTSPRAPEESSPSKATGLTGFTTTPEREGPSPTTSVCEEWTPWINLDRPSTGHGDVETMEKARRKWPNFCPKPMKIQCRDAGSKISVDQVSQELLCDLEHGLLCINENQYPNNCNDYEIRFYCDCYGNSCACSWLAQACLFMGWTTRLFMGWPHVLPVSWLGCLHQACLLFMGWHTPACSWLAQAMLAVHGLAHLPVQLPVHGLAGTACLFMGWHRPACYGLAHAGCLFIKGGLAARPACSWAAQPACSWAGTGLPVHVAGTGLLFMGGWHRPVCSWRWLAQACLFMGLHTPACSCGWHSACLFMGWQQACLFMGCTGLPVHGLAQQACLKRYFNITVSVTGNSEPGTPSEAPETPRPENSVSNLQRLRARETPSQSPETPRAENSVSGLIETRLPRTPSQSPETPRPRELRLSPRDSEPENSVSVSRDSEPENPSQVSRDSEPEKLRLNPETPSRENSVSISRDPSPRTPSQSPETPSRELRLSLQRLRGPRTPSQSPETPRQRLRAPSPRNSVSVARDSESENSVSVARDSRAHELRLSLQRLRARELRPSEAPENLRARELRLKSRRDCRARELRLNLQRLRSPRTPSQSPKTPEPEKLRLSLQRIRARELRLQSPETPSPRTPFSVARDSEPTNSVSVSRDSESENSVSVSRDSEPTNSVAVHAFCNARNFYRLSGPTGSTSTTPSTGEGDIETIDKARDRWPGFCPQPISIQCRDSDSKKDVTDIPQELICDVNQGLVCKNEHQYPTKCLDYEVRYFCECFETQTPSESTRTPSPRTPSQSPTRDSRAQRTPSRVRPRTPSQRGLGGVEPSNSPPSETPRDSENPMKNSSLSLQRLRSPRTPCFSKRLDTEDSKSVAVHAFCNARKLLPSVRSGPTGSTWTTPSTGEGDIETIDKARETAGPDSVLSQSASSAETPTRRRTSSPTFLKELICDVNQGLCVQETSTSTRPKSVLTSRSATSASALTLSSLSFKKIGSKERKPIRLRVAQKSLVKFIKNYV
uniref:EGF-like domain-containing protein n=1 Tax=Macrostomum lignano TaxID=282301 RepID=A0A1I8JRM6_9PLAT